MLGKFQMSVVTLESTAIDLANRPNYKIAMLSGDTNLLSHPNIYDASILVPPTELIMLWADGNIIAMTNQYPLYLNNKDQDEMILALIAASYTKNIVLFMSDAEFDMYGSILLLHIYNKYGIQCTLNGYGKFWVDYSKLHNIINGFFMMDLINGKTYLEAYPTNIDFPQYVIPKLIEYFGDPFEGKTMRYSDYYWHFKEMNYKLLPKMEMATMVNK